MVKKRNKVDIIHDMLKIILENKGNVKKTHLMYKANLSHKQMEIYLSELMEKKFIEKDDSSKNQFIKVTKKGTDFVIKYIQIREFEKTFGL
tara:strand:+ start:2291 stop:2563 length:273 start_codon:yes stop_codon:yes gene_type:complete